MMRAIEFKLSAEFGTFKVPDRQVPSLTFNFIPKSAVLGAIGAILGFNGYEQGTNSPDFITHLANVKIGIMPELPLDRYGRTTTFRKTFVGFLNYHGYGNADGPLQIREQLLVRPSYVITVIAEKNNIEFNNLIKALKSDTTTFRPYLGKNEFIANLTFLHEYEVEECTKEIVSCQSIFPRNLAFSPGRYSMQIPDFVMIDRYPYSLDSDGNYILKYFEYRVGNIHVNEADNTIGKFYHLKSKGEIEKVVYAF